MRMNISDIKIMNRHRKDMGDIEGLADSIGVQGLLQPIGINENNELIFGERRLKAVSELLGWDSIEARIVNVTSIVEGEYAENEVRKDFTPSERVAIAKSVEESIGERRGRPAKEMNELDLFEEEKVADVPQLIGIKTREIAAAKAGFSSTTNYRQAKKVVESGTPELVEAMDSGKVSISAAAVIANEPKEEQQEAIEKKKAHVSHNSGNNEWFTPEAYIISAKKVMGGIDLDPASCEEANRIVKAGEYYDIESDGLKQEWHGRVWLNPPYSSNLINSFCDKLVESLGSGVSQAIVLVNNATETNWFYNLITNASAFVFTKGRVKFISISGEKGAPLQGQAIIYFGDKGIEFLTEFRQYGWGGFLNE